jgi:hypothetical protein
LMGPGVAQGWAATLFVREVGAEYELHKKEAEFILLYSC